MSRPKQHSKSHIAIEWREEREPGESSKMENMNMTRLCCELYVDEISLPTHASAHQMWRINFFSNWFFNFSLEGNERILHEISRLHAIISFDISRQKEEREEKWENIKLNTIIILFELIRVEQTICNTFHSSLPYSALLHYACLLVFCTTFLFHVSPVVERAWNGAGNEKQCFFLSLSLHSTMG